VWSTAFCHTLTLYCIFAKKSIPKFVLRSISRTDWLRQLLPHMLTRARRAWYAPPRRRDPVRTRVRRDRRSVTGGALWGSCISVIVGPLVIVLTLALWDLLVSEKPEPARKPHVRRIK